VEYTVTFTPASREFPPIIVSDCINRPGYLDEARDRQTDRQRDGRTDGHRLIMPPPVDVKHNKLCRWHGIPPTAVPSVEWLITLTTLHRQLRHYFLTLTFDLLTLKLLCIIARGMGNLPTNFGVSGSFRSRLIGQHLSDVPRHDLTTLTFDLRGHSTY